MQQMYCDLRMFNAYPAAQIPHYSQSSPNQMFQYIISKAVAEGFKRFCIEKVSMQVRNVNELALPLQKAPNASNAVIDLCSDSQEFEGNSPSGKQIEEKALSTVRHSSCAASSGPQEPEISLSHHINQQEKLEASIQKQIQIEEPFYVIRKEEMMEQEECIVDFNARCPQMGMAEEEILRRKERLLRRQVNNWGEIPQKGRNQRREIRMLHN